MHGRKLKMRKQIGPDRHTKGCRFNLAFLSPLFFFSSLFFYYFSYYDYYSSSSQRMDIKTQERVMVKVTRAKKEKNTPRQGERKQHQKNRDYTFLKRPLTVNQDKRLLKS